ATCVCVSCGRTGTAGALRPGPTHRRLLAPNHRRRVVQLQPPTRRLLRARLISLTSGREATAVAGRFSRRPRRRTDNVHVACTEMTTHDPCERAESPYPEG